MGTGGWFSYGSSGSGEPPDDAYSRFSNPERFGPLHEWALEAVARLQRDYEVTVEEGHGMDAELERAPLSRSTLNRPLGHRRVPFLRLRCLRRNAGGRIREVYEAGKRCCGRAVSGIPAPEAGRRWMEHQGILVC